MERGGNAHWFILKKNKLWSNFRIVSCQSDISLGFGECKCEVCDLQLVYELNDCYNLDYD